MQKTFLVEQTQLLEEKKQNLETQLRSFAEKSHGSKDDWSAKMPQFDGANLEEEADAVEEFGTRLALERTLESELKDVNLALEKIKKGKYGICEKCGGKIREERLQVYPQAKHCTKCQ